MIVEKIILNRLLKTKSPLNFIPVVYHSSDGGIFDEKYPIGKREWVGYGLSSSPNYLDRPDFPMPAVRFKEITADLIPLKEKEKGDWKNLTIEEKKTLYRASFRQTFAEIDAPTGQWKSVFGWSFFFIALGLWVYILEKEFMHRPQPETFSEERRAHQLRKALDIKFGHITGVSSKWDYEKDDWKK